MFSRATITLSIGPHSSYQCYSDQYTGFTEVDETTIQRLLKGFQGSQQWQRPKLES